MRPSAAALALTMLLAACGGGGGGAPDPATPPDRGSADLQTLPAARASIDLTRGIWHLMSDVQNILVAAPSDSLRGNGGVACDGGGRYDMTVAERSLSPFAIRYRTQFDNCRISGVLMHGVVEVSATRSVVESAEQPWAGTVRFDNYSIEGSTRRREYHGEVTAEGRLNVAGDLSRQPFRARFINLSLRETGDSLGRATRFSTPDFQVDRLATASVVSQVYEMAGRWNLQAGTWAAVMAIAPGSQLALLENAGSGRFTASLQWSGDSAVPDFSGTLSLSPVGTSSLRVELDLDGNGQPDRSAVYDRVTDIGLRL